MEVQQYVAPARADAETRVHEADSYNKERSSNGIRLRDSTCYGLSDITYCSTRDRTSTAVRFQPPLLSLRLSTSFLLCMQRSHNIISCAIECILLLPTAYKARYMAVSRRAPCVVVEDSWWHHENELDIFIPSHASRRDHMVHKLGKGLQRNG
jgi:hypothetical protein